MAEVTVDAAAQRLGLSVDQVRRRIRSGRLSSRTNEDGRILVTVPDLESPPTPPASASDPLAAASESPAVWALRVQLAEYQALADAGERQREALERHIGDLERQVANLEERLAAADVERSELRQLLLRATLQIESLIPKLPPAPTEAEAEPERRPWWRWW